MATVRQSGGDYGSLNAALAAAESTITIDQAWTANDTTKATISADVTITVSGAAKQPGYWNTAGNHYRLVCTGGHCLTLNGAYTATIDGIAINQNGTGTSDEGFRCVPGTSDTVTIKNSLFRCSNNTDQQDCIYTGFNTSIGTITLEQCVIQRANRGGIHIQNGFQATPTATFNLNSCTIWNNGRGGSDAAGTRGGGVYCSYQTGNRTGITINIHNTVCVENDTGNASARDFNEDVATSTPAWNISYSIDSDNSIATVRDTGTGNLASRTATDSDTPGAGNWVVFEDITTSPFDLRLKDNAENDAQNRHAVATAHSLTIPAADIVGTSRPQNTNYDIGAFEIVVAASGGSITLSLDALLQKTGIVETVNIDALIQKQLSAQLSLDSAVQDSFSATLSADSILQSVLSGQVSLDSLLQASASINVSIDSLLQSADISATTVLDALLRDSLSSTVALDAVLTGGSAASLVLDSLLQSGQVTTADIDAVLQTQDVTATAVIDGLLQAQAITASAVVDALLQQAKTGTLSIDAVLTGAAGTNASVSLDSLLQAAQSAGTSIDAMLQAVDQTAIASVDAALQQLKTATISLDSLLQSAASTSASIDALLQVAALSATLNIDSLLQQLKTGTISIDAFLISASTVGLSLDAKLLGTNSGTLSIDAIIGVVTQAISKAGFTIQTRAFGFRKLSG